MRAYIGLLRKEPGTSYGVDFPDFPGCITASETLAGVEAMAVEALTLHIEGLREDGDAIPDPSGLSAILADPLNHHAVPILVPLPDQLFQPVHGAAAAE